jgi:hypothetical protein
MRQQPIQVTVDIVVFTVYDEALKVLLIKRGIAPFQGQLPCRAALYCPGRP